MLEETFQKPEDYIKYQILFDIIVSYAFLA